MLSFTSPRYLAREYGLNGATNQENAQVQLSIVDFLFLVTRQIFNGQLSIVNCQADEIVDVINDMQQAIVSPL